MKSTPHVGDIVFYDANVNESFCMTFGYGIYLAKIVGLPGDTVKFYNNSYEIRGKIYPAEKRYFNGSEEIVVPTNLRGVKWGSEIYDNLEGQTLVIPDGEYLVDQWIGRECLQGTIINGSTATANRFTVKRDAIIGVVLFQMGHSNYFQEAQNVVY